MRNLPVLVYVPCGVTHFFWGCFTISNTVAVYKQGEVGDAFYIIYKGSVRVQVREESATAANSKSYALNSMRIAAGNTSYTSILNNNVYVFCRGCIGVVIV